MENMDVGYVPSNPNPLNIEIGPPSSGIHRITDGINTAAELGDVQINENFVTGLHSSAGKDLTPSAPNTVAPSAMMVHQHNSSHGSAGNGSST